MCKKYSICEVVLGILVIVVALTGLPYKEWILTLIGIGLILHSFVCKHCRCECDMDKNSKAEDTKSKVRNRRK